MYTNICSYIFIYIYIYVYMKGSAPSACRWPLSSGCCDCWLAAWLDCACCACLLAVIACCARLLACWLACLLTCLLACWSACFCRLLSQAGVLFCVVLVARVAISEDGGSMIHRILRQNVTLVVCCILLDVKPSAVRFEISE